MIFVVSKVLVRFKRTPRIDDCLEVRTWNSGTQGVSFVRDYVMTVNGEEVGRATTRWVLVSYSARRILRPEALFTNVTTNAEEDVIMEPARRINLIADAAVSTDRYLATLTDMDTNYHVNNTRYGDLLINYSGLDYTDRSVSEFEIHFTSELKSGESVVVSSTADNNTACVTAAKEGGQQVFSARVELM